MAEILPYFTAFIMVIFAIAIYIGVQEIKNKNK